MIKSNRMQAEKLYANVYTWHFDVCTGSVAFSAGLAECQDMGNVQSGSSIGKDPPSLSLDRSVEFLSFSILFVDSNPYVN